MRPFYIFYLILCGKMVAINFNIPLIFYGEDGEVEYGGTTKTQDKFLYDNSYVEQVYLSNVYKKIFGKVKISHDDKFFYDKLSSNLSELKNLCIDGINIGLGPVSSFVTYMKFS